MRKCENCCGNCGSCGGSSLELNTAELDILQKLSQIPFLPVGRKADDVTPIYPENDAFADGDPGVTLQCLEKKGLISIDYSQPLKGFHNALYDTCPIRGSFALTERGQQILELLDIQGIDV